MLLSLLAACASGPQQQAQLDPRNGDGLGGTGIKSGMQMVQLRRGDGLGGTGIIGTISGFGSIIVNGLELEFNNSTSVATDGRPASLQELRVGQVVQGIARERDGKLTLSSLDIQHAVTGPITSVDQAGQSLVVLGQKIKLNLAGDKAALDAFKTLQAGDVVSVSGLRLADGTIVATRVDEQHDDGRLVLRGEVAAVNPSSVRVGDLEVPLVADAVVGSPKIGGRIVVSGRMINGKFAPQVITSGNALPFGDTVSDVSLEAYAPADAGTDVPLSIHGVNIAGASLPAGTQANDHILISGKIDGSDKVTAAAIKKIRTVVTVLAAQGSVRPAAIRPDISRPDRVRPPERPERPQSLRPEIARPDFEKPSV